MEFDGRKFILTAAHVVPVKPYDIQFIPPPRDGFRISPSLSNERFRRSQRYDLKSCIGDHSLDLAAILFYTPPELAFFDLHMYDSPPWEARLLSVATPLRRREWSFLTVTLGTARTGLSVCNGRALNVRQRYKVTPICDRLSSDAGTVSPPGYSGSMVWYDTAGYRTIQDLRTG